MPAVLGLASGSFSKESAEIYIQTPSLEKERRPHSDKGIGENMIAK